MFRKEVMGMARLKVGIIFGGKSGEHEVSLMSAASVIKYMPSDKYESVLIGITKEGKWITEGNPWEILKTGSPNVQGGPIPVNLLASLDVVFPVLHGTFGEDGTIQGLFEMCNVPYVGAGVMASSASMDKAIMKSVFRDHGLPLVKEKVVMRSQWKNNPDKVCQDIINSFDFPVFVKPANLGSSVGISKVNNGTELRKALDLASLYDYKLIVEEFVPAREIECAVLGNDDPQASVVGEIVPHNEYYDYEAKYTDGKADLIIPAKLDPEVIIEVQRLAIAAYKAVDCSGLGRVDFFLHRSTGEIIVNEINTLPGFTHLSMYPLLWEASGLSYPKLISKLIELALERHGTRQQLSTSRC
jgi:D-alanine-D-alanine ligase